MTDSIEAPKKQSHWFGRLSYQILGLVIILLVILGIVLVINGRNSDKSTHQKNVVVTKKTDPNTKTFRFSIWVVGEPPSNFTIPAGEDCTGSDVSDSFYDITDISQVIVRNAFTEKIIARVTLGSGKSMGKFCNFSTTIKLTKGSDHGQGYTFEVNNPTRGTVLKSWNQLVEDPDILVQLGSLSSGS